MSMTVSEALKYFKDANRTNDIVCVLPKSDIGNVLIKALDKQIPKKPDRWESGHACCYSCKRGIVREDNYCCYCGQKLDWSDEE